MFAFAVVSRFSHYHFLFASHIRNIWEGFFSSKIYIKSFIFIKERCRTGSHFVIT